MEHKSIGAGDVHQPHNFAYATAAERLSAVITDASLLNRLALQTDVGSFWRLSSVAPAVWVGLVGSNEAGLVQVSYGSTLSVGALVASTPKTFDIGAATPSVLPSSTYPNSAPTKTYADFFDAARGTLPNGRLIENPINGQLHLWTVSGSYSGKATAEVGSLKMRLRNLASGSLNERRIILLAGILTDTFSVDFYSTADASSITPPNGYVLDVIADFAPVGIQINISSITRLSFAIDPR